MARTRRTALFLASEAGSYSTDPSANGSGYVYVPVIGQMSLLKDGLRLLETNYHTGRNFPTPPVAGPDGWSFDCTVPLNGLSTAAGDGVTPVANDWLDILLTHIFGSQTVVDGEGFNAGSNSTLWVLDTSPYALQHLIPAFEAGIPSAAPRTQWGLATADAGSGNYTVAPTQSGNPTTAAIAYGTKAYQFDDDGGNSLAFVYRQDDVDYTCLGGRCTGATIMAAVGELVVLKLSFAGDTKTQEAKGSLPAITANTRTLRSLLSPAWFNNTQYPTSKIEIDLGITAVVRESTQAANGRANYELVYAAPKVMIEPIYADAITTLKRAQTAGRLLVQLGGGLLSGGVLNAMAFHAEQAVAMEADATDASGIIRQGVTFQVTDPVEFSAGVSARYCQLVRA